MRRSLPPQIIQPRHRIQTESSITDLLLLVGAAFEVAAGRRDAALAACRTALEHWVELGLGHALGPSGERLFDPVEVFTFMKSAGFAGEDDFWETHFVRTGRALVTSLATHLDASGKPHLTMNGPRRFSLRLERQFNLAHCPRHDRLRLKLPLPLSGTYIHDLSVEALTPPTPDARMTVAPGRLEALLPSRPTSSFVTLGADVTFTATSPRQAPAGDPPPDIYLRREEGMIRVTERIRREAQARLCVGDPLATAEAFWSFLIEDFACGPIHYDGIDAASAVDWVLDHGWYDCQLASALFVSLCRAVDIPARIIGGNFLYGLAPANHYWAEIWISGEGWLPFDFIGWDFSRGGRDVDWLALFAANLDYRMVTECLPLDFVGPMSARLPASWQMSQTSEPEGVTISFHDVADNTVVYSDTILVRDA